MMMVKMMLPRLVIYKKIAITVVIVVFAIVHKAEGRIDAFSVTSTTSARDVTALDHNSITSRESKQIVEFFMKGDTDKFLVSLRTFLMGVRNMAEALGGFVPNDQHTEKNAMISRYSGIFNTVRVVSNAIQYVARFLEDLLIREIDDTNEGRQSKIVSTLTSMMTPFRGAFKVVRSAAARLISVYNYYSPEIIYSQCVAQFVQREFPEFLPKTFEVLTSTYSLAKNYLRRVFTPTTDLVHPQDNHLELDKNDLHSEVLLDSGQPSSTIDYRQQLFELYKKNPDRSHTVQSRAFHILNNRRIDIGVGPYIDPEALDNVDLSMEPIDTSSQNSIFNFENNIGQPLGVNPEGLQDNPEDNQPNFGKCTQFYAMDVFWRLLSGFILSEDWKII